MSDTSTFVCSHTVAINAFAHDIWAVWADVNSWSTLDSGLAESRLRGNFRAGNGFTLVRKSGEAMDGVIVSVTQGEEFSDEVKLDYGTIRNRHWMEPLGELVKVTHEVEARIEIDQAPAFAQGVWVDVQRSLTESLDEILATVEP